MSGDRRDVAALVEREAGPFTAVVGERPRRGGDGDRRRSRRWGVAAALAVAWAAVDAVVGADGGIVNPAGWPVAARVLAAALEPELGGDFLQLTVVAAATTAAYAVVGAAIGTASGVVVGVILSETWWRAGEGDRRGRPPVGWYVARLGASAPRGLHEGVWGALLVLVLGLDPLVAVLALALPSAAVTAKVVADLVDEHRGAAHGALRALGAGRLAAIAYGVAPTLRADVVSYAFYRLECAVRGAVVLGLVGAGGLGTQLALSLQSLRYEEVWTLIGAVLVLAAVVDAWSARVRGDQDRRTAAWSLVAALGLVAVAGWHLRLDPTALTSPRTLGLLGELVAEAVPVQLPDGGVGRLAVLGLETLQVALLGTALAGVAGTALAFVAARTDRHRGRSLAARLLLLLARAVPAPVGALVLLFVLRPGVLPGALALGAYTTGVLGRLVAEAVEHLDPAPAEALRAGGAPPLVAFAYATLPQVLPRALAHTLERGEVALRETVVVGLVGAGGLGRLLAEQLARFAYAEAVATLAALGLLTFVVDVVSGAARRALR